VGDDPARNWIGIAQTARGLQDVKGDLQMLAGQVDQGLPPNPLAGLFPFAVYCLPSFFRTVQNPTTDWLKFRVHGGRVNEADATNTDGENSDSSAEALMNFATAWDVQVPVGKGLFYFWGEYVVAGGTTTARVLYGTDPTAASYSDSSSSPSHPWDHSSAPWSGITAWSTFPKPDGAHALIASVDVNNITFPYIPVVRQYVRNDILVIGGGSGASFSTYVFQSLAAGTDAVTNETRYYAVCYPFNPLSGWSGSYSGSPVHIALPARLQPPKICAVTGGGSSPTEYALNLGPIQYDYTNFLSKQERTATAITSGQVEYQFVCPLFETQDTATGQTLICPTVLQAVAAATGVKDAGGSLLGQIMVGEFAFAWDPNATS
jgi:hypothetical protein